MSVSSTKLYLLSTPFQALVANRIINKEGQQNVDGVYIDFTGKMDPCHTALRKFRLDTHLDFLSIRNGPHKLWDLWRAYKYLTKRIRNTDSVLLSNPRSLFLRRALLSAGKNQFESFDDGFWNISRTGPFFEEKDLGLLARTFVALGLVPSYKSFVRMSRCHYTIYKAPNAMSHVSNMKLLSGLFEIDENWTSGGDERVVYLGNLLVEEGRITLNRYKEHMLLVTKKYGISEVLPHPRGDERKYQSMGLSVQVPLKLAEEYILEIRQESKICVLASYCTALVNLAGLDGIRVIHIPLQNCGYSKDADLVMTECGVDIDYSFA